MISDDPASFWRRHHKAACDFLERVISTRVHTNQTSQTAPDNAVSPDAAAKPSKHLPNMSSSDWTAFAAGLLWFIAGAAGLIAAMVALFAWNLARKDATAKEEALSKYKRESSERVAVLEKQTAEAKLELARLTQPRTISPQQKEAFLNFMRDKPKGKVNLAILAMDNESNSYVQRLFELLQEAGFTLPGSIMAPIGGFGLHASNATTSTYLLFSASAQPPAHAGALRGAFQAAGIVVAVVDTVNSGLPVAPDEVVIGVTEKR